jgi:predicted Rossmann fold flavoprotein
MVSKFDALILGGGAAGLLCAIEAGKRGRKVAVLERADRAGKKILVSGGGRCNFTNIHCQPDNFISANPHFAKSALARYTPADFIALVEKHRIPYHEKTLGQLFCDRSARDITDMLESECRAAGAAIVLNCGIREALRDSEFIVRAESGEFRAPSVVVATGGISIPKMGATGFGYDLARQFGLKIRATKPGLVPLVFSAIDRKNYCDLAGISTEVLASAHVAANARAEIPAEVPKNVPADVQVNVPAFRESMLFTHRGLSGPAILQASSYWNGGDAIRIDLAPGQNVIAPILNSKTRNIAAARSVFQRILPNRFANRWLDLHAPSGWSDQSLAALERAVHEWEIKPAGTEGYEKAEVTVGGVDTDELSSKTMESRKVPGLYFIGEVVDVTGHLGGCNFQWAWSSGAAAGRAL